MKHIKLRCINKEGCFLLEKYDECTNGIYDATYNDGDDFYAVGFGRHGFMWINKNRFEIIEQDNS